MRWNPELYRTSAPFVPAGGAPLVALLDPAPGERVLDLGCGDGHLTASLLDRGAVVVGVDASPEMVRAARHRGIDARVVDAEHLDYHEEFDAVLTNAALHWMRDLPAVLAGVARALRPGGRFVGEMAGPGNLAAVGLAVTAALRGRGLSAPGNPWHSRSTGEFAGLLTDAGLRVDAVESFPRPTPLPLGLRSWLDTFGGALLGHLDPELAADVVADAVELARPWLCDGGGRWTADYVRLRFSAHRADGLA